MLLEDVRVFAAHVMMNKRSAVPPTIIEDIAIGPGFLN